MIDMLKQFIKVDPVEDPKINGNRRLSKLVVIFDPDTNEILSAYIENVTPGGSNESTTD